MRVPDEDGLGNAKVTFSFPAWKEARVSPSTIDLPVSRPKPMAK